MNITTKTLSGAEICVAIGGQNTEIRNDGAATVYASANPNIVAGADGVVAIHAGEPVTVLDTRGRVYLLGTGEVSVVGKDTVASVFKCAPSAGGSGQDDVARQAITAHAGNAEIHVTAEEKAAWNAKAEMSDIPTTLPADGGNADTLDGKHASDFISTTELAFQSICPSNVFLYDNLNSPSVMVKIPKMTWAQLGVGDSTEIFPAFIVNGQEVDALYFPKYENIVRNNRGYSLPAQDPAVSVNFDQSIQYSANKGAGWHSMTRLEWCVIALWCLKNGFQPNGNNKFGKDISESTYKAIPTVFNADGTPARIATGTGPLTWSHNNAPDGIYDLNGNVWEWTTGVRSVYGELQVLSHDGVTFGNDAAHPANSQAADSALWRAIDGTTGALITPDGSGTTANSLKLDFTSSGWKWVTGTISSKQNSNRSAEFESTTVDSTVCVAAQRILQALCLYKANDTVGAYKNDRFWGNNGAAETLFVAGGHWTDSVGAGVFEVTCCYPRSDSSGGLGFRSAFVNLPVNPPTV